MTDDGGAFGSDYKAGFRTDGKPVGGSRAQRSVERLRGQATSLLRGGESHGACCPLRGAGEVRASASRRNMGLTCPEGARDFIRLRALCLTFCRLPCCSAS